MSKNLRKLLRDSGLVLMNPAEWNLLFRKALADFRERVPPLVVYTSERGTTLIMRTNLERPVGIYLHGESRTPLGGFLDYHDRDLDAIGYTKLQYEQLPLVERARLNAQIQVEKFGKRNAIAVEKKRGGVE